MIVIKKRVSLDFLGETYKDSYLDIKSISLRERDALIAELDKVKKDESKSFDFVKDLVLERFIGGELKEGDATTTVTKDDLLDFPAEVFFEILQQLQGRVSPN